MQTSLVTPVVVPEPDELDEDHIGTVYRAKSIAAFTPVKTERAQGGLQCSNSSNRLALQGQVNQLTFAEAEVNGNGKRSSPHDLTQDLAVQEPPTARRRSSFAAASIKLRSSITSSSRGTRADTYTYSDADARRLTTTCILHVNYCYPV